MCSVDSRRDVEPASDFTLSCAVDILSEIMYEIQAMQGTRYQRLCRLGIRRHGPVTDGGGGSVDCSCGGLMLSFGG